MGVVVAVDIGNRPRRRRSNIRKAAHRGLDVPAGFQRGAGAGRERCKREPVVGLRPDKNPRAVKRE